MENSAPGELKSQRLPFLKHVITIGDTRKPGSITFDDLINSGTAEDHITMNAVSAKVQFDRDAFIQFSSASALASEPPRRLHSSHAGAATTARSAAAARASAVCAFQRSDVIAAADALAPPRAQLCASVAQ
ncbi:hypothetical protein HPB47_021057 [Ixodes persulcatus]|uniref:Uncharacterized protein n=1 Tax=Ixodes persulcatus TaxID=34615 RepID=A0AC60QDM6_IXOPE|nr:hypothetical protein HPB47_021057 [Ixodes persulcatus]